MKTRGIAEICNQLQVPSTVREVCQNGLRLIKEKLTPERVSIFLKEIPADSATPFYGFYGVDQPIETKEHLSLLTKGFPGKDDPSCFVNKNTDVVDFQGGVRGQADQLCVAITSCSGKLLGWLVVDNLIEKKKWTPAPIDTFQLFSVVLANILSLKNTLVQQKRDALQVKTLLDSLPGAGVDRIEKEPDREKETAEQRAAFINTIFDNLEDRFYFKDRQSRLLGANMAWLKAKNAVSLDELIGKTDMDFFPGPMGKQLYEAEQHQMATGATTRVREKHIDPYGKVSYVEAIKCPMRDEKNVVIGLAGISRDVTRQVESEKELIAARKEADSARMQAELAAKAKSAFLANMSHEIRTPLNAVIGMTTLMAESEMDEEQRDFVRIIQTSGEALLTLINDILDLSKIEAGALRLEAVPFNLRRCVESSLDIVAAKAFEKGLELACSVNGEVPQVFIGDPARLRQILLNLINNAIKFTDAGEVVVRVSGTKVRNQRHRLDFSVRDTGIGMSEETARRIFKPFEQADSSTTRKYGGTGLGLSICNKLVEMMGGSLHVKSRVGEGSEFSFNIILRRAESDVSAQAGINREVLKNRRALIVDDNHTNLQILEAQLREWDVTPLAFSKGADALKHLGSLGNVEFAVLDMMMPDMDGEMLSAALRKRPEFMERPILILSSTGNAAITENPSANAWLTKPAKPDRLLEKLAMLVENAETGKLMHPVKMEPQVGYTLGLTHPLRILVAEDNIVNQKVALKLLSRLGYEADLASNGLEAVEAVQNKIYDLVLMDIQMPLMNGLDATEKILQLYPGGNGPKVVAMTAHALQESKQEGLACGMSGYIVKPIRFETLIDALKEIPRRED